MAISCAIIPMDRHSKTCETAIRVPITVGLPLIRMADDPSIPWICLVFRFWFTHAQMLVLVLALRNDSIADDVTRACDDARTA